MERGFSAMKKRIIFLMLLILLLVNVSCEKARDVTLSLEIEGKGISNLTQGQHFFEPNALVEISVKPDSGWYFSHWDGTDGDKIIVVDKLWGEYQIAMSKDQEIIAVFKEINNPVNLQIDIEGNGNCSLANTQFPQGAIAKIVVTAADKSAFDQWSGKHAADVEEIDVLRGEYRIVMDADKDLTAIFRDLTKKVPQDYKTIQAAIDDAADGDTVIVEVGTYYENINFNGKNITLTSTNPEDEEIIKTTIIDGNNEGRVVVFENEETSEAKLTGFTIQNGNAPGNSYGGGIYIDNAAPIILNNYIIENTAGRGAGICVTNQGAPLIQSNLIAANNDGCGLLIINQSIVDVKYNVIKNNQGGYAGGIRIGFGTNHNCEVLIKGNRIVDNTTTAGSGGISIKGSEVDIIQNYIVNNSGGGSFLAAGGITIRRESKVHLEENSILYNQAQSYGGLVVGENSQVMIVNNTIMANDAGNQWNDLYGSGGGISIVDSVADIIDNKVTMNESFSRNSGGGGIYVRSSEVLISRNTIQGNKALNAGGGIYLRGHGFTEDSTATIRYNFIYNNRATGKEHESRGGGIAVGNIIYCEIYANFIALNRSDRFGGGIYFSENAPAYGLGGIPYARVNSPPLKDPHNLYIANNHGDNDCGGRDVFFRERYPCE